MLLVFSDRALVLLHSLGSLRCRLFIANARLLVTLLLCHSCLHAKEIPDAFELVFLLILFLWPAYQG